MLPIGILLGVVIIGCIFFIFFRPIPDIADEPVKPEELDSLVNRLRGIYTLPVNDGAGLLAGSDTFTREFPFMPPIQGEAAERIDALNGLVCHCWVHQGYFHCGYLKMTTEQKKLYCHIIGAKFTPTEPIFE